MNLVLFAVLMLWSTALVALFIAAATDIRERRIPNALVLIVLAQGMALRIVEGGGTFWPSLLLALALLVIGAWLASHQVIGAGDAKMIAAVSMLIPATAVPGLLVCIALTGGVLSGIYLGIAWLLGRRGQVGVVQYQPHLSDGNVAPGARQILSTTFNRSMPYGVAIFGGVVSFIIIGALT